jgi:3-methyladenine DNA glycosylase AlkD
MEKSLIMQLLEIRKILKNTSSKKNKESTLKFVPTVRKQYGVKVAVLNELVKQIKEPDFGLIEKLWESGIFEERLLASKFLGKICKTNPTKTLKLIKKFSKDISDWVICDTLATQGIRKIISLKQKEIFEISKKLVKSKDLWQRRFGLVILINFTKDKDFRQEIKEILKSIKDEKELYVKKAIIWLKNELEVKK